MGQGRSRRARPAQGGCARPGHAHLHPQGLRPDRGALRPRAFPRHRAARRSSSLRHAVPGGFDRRVPGGEPRADEHAAAPEAPQILRPRHRGRHRAPRPHPGRHGASLFAPPLRRRGDRLPLAPSRPRTGRRAAPGARQDHGRAAVPGAGHAPGHGGGEILRARGERASPRHGHLPPSRHHRASAREDGLAAWWRAVTRKNSPSAASTRSRASANMASPRATPRASPISSMSRPGSNAITLRPLPRRCSTPSPWASMRPRRSCAAPASMAWRRARRTSITACGTARWSPPPPARGRVAMHGVQRRVGVILQSRQSVSTPSPSLPLLGREKSFALRLGLRQIDGLREDDVKTLVSKRDGAPGRARPASLRSPASA